MYSSLFMYKMTWICFPKYQFPAHILSKCTVQTRPTSFLPIFTFEFQCQFCATEARPCLVQQVEIVSSHLIPYPLVHAWFVPYRMSPLFAYPTFPFLDSGLPCDLTHVGFVLTSSGCPSEAGQESVPLFLLPFLFPHS